MFKKRLLGLGIFILVIILIVGCSSNKGDSKENGTKSSNTLSIYTAFPEQEVVPYIQAFEESTGIDVKFVRLSAGETLARLQAEEGNAQASVWFGGSSDTFVAGINADVIEPYQPENVSDLPEDFIDETGHWTPIYVGALGFANNTEWFEREDLDFPESWDDLLKPEFKGEISMAHPSSSGTAYTVLATLVQHLGEDEAFDYLKKLDVNMRRYTKSGSAPAEDAGLAEAGIGISFSHDILAPMNEGYPIELGFPSDGTGYEIGAVALIKGAPSDEIENAKKFIDWTISKEAQDLYSETESFRLPINPEAKVPEGTVELEDLDLIDYDAVWAGENRKELLDRFDKEIRGEEVAE